MDQHYQDIFSRAADEPNCEAFLEKLTADFPYFAPAHFYLLKHTSPEDPAYAQRAAKAAVFFDDLFFLQHRLSDKENSGNIAAPAEEIPSGELESVKEISSSAGRAETSEPVAASFNSFHAESASLENMPQDESLPTSHARAAAHASMEDMPMFEPLHATDYFASQGIKLGSEAGADDKLGRQLRSFTSWLKTMKKIPSAPGDLPAPGEIAVKALAERSNLEEEVITEAMAEACLRQGKRGKAAEIYGKLSLLNPSKSAYFAAKIESIKE